MTGAPQTMLATLYAKALDAEAEKPLLGDTAARDAVRRIEYDWRRTSVTARNQSGVTVRTVHFDDWAREFLARHERATVLLIAEGLTMYLTEREGIALLRAVVDRFPSGELQFDAFNALGIRSRKINAVVRRAGATLHRAVNGPGDIVSAVPGAGRSPAVSLLRGPVQVSVVVPRRRLGEFAAGAT